MASKQCFCVSRKKCFLVCQPSGNMARKQCFLVCPPLRDMARKQCFLVCPPLRDMARKQCFLVCPPSGIMARRQCLMVCRLWKTWLYRKQCFLFCLLWKTGLENVSLSCYLYDQVRLILAQYVRLIYFKIPSLSHPVYSLSRLVLACTLRKIT